MKSVAIIPLRAGSKGIPNKNKLKILGRPLFSWVLTEAIFSKLDEIYVFTDDKYISDFVQNEYKWLKKVKVINRSEESATDTSSTEFSMIELAEKINYNFDIYCLLQATSPLTQRNNINEALDKISDKICDSVLSVVETKRFIWSSNGENLNYDYLNRPRRQEFNGMLVENGAVYATTKDSFIKTKNRLGGKIQPIEMPEDTLVEIDEKTDFLIVEQLIKNRLANSKGAIGKISTLCLDVDGVFTDATISVSAEGEFSKTFSYRDGMGLEKLRDIGLKVIVLTSEKSGIVKQRMKKLNITDTYVGIKDKYTFLENLCIDSTIERNEIAYLGDDINDLANIASCGMGMCPYDAEMEVQANADYVLKNKGGKRVIREACEFILKHNKRF